MISDAYLRQNEFTWVVNTGNGAGDSQEEHVEKICTMLRVASPKVLLCLHVRNAIH